MKWTAGMVVDALRAAYGLTGDHHLNTEEWAFLTEVLLRAPSATQPGWARTPDNHWSANTRTIDVLAIRNWTSGIGHQRVAIEVKVSRADYKRETDLKRQPAEVSAHRTAYAAPAGLIDPDTLPAGWGLIEVHPDRAAAEAAKGHPFGAYNSPVRWRVKAAKREPVCDLDYLAAALARRASRAEERIRRGSDDAALVPQLKAETVRAQDAEQRARDALHVAKEESRRYRSELLALAGDTVCDACDKPVRYVRDKYNGSEWAHVDPADDQLCHVKRVEANRLRREAATGARYLSGYPEPISPKVVRDREREQTA